MSLCPTHICSSIAHCTPRERDRGGGAQRERDREGGGESAREMADGQVKVYGVPRRRRGGGRQEEVKAPPGSARASRTAPVGVHTRTPAHPHTLTHSQTDTLTHPHPHTLTPLYPHTHSGGGATALHPWGSE